MMSWLRNEDSSLKMKLQGLTVTDANAPAGGRTVPVRYRLPEDELAGLSYPVIIIEHAGLYPAPEREHRGRIQLPYAPEGFQPWYSGPENAVVADSPYYAYFPMPYNFDYNVTVYARFMTQHAQPLAAILATEQYLPAKFGFLTIPQDGTVRSMFLMGGPEFGYGKDEDGKRMITVSYRIRVFSELVQGVQSMVAYGGTLVPVNTVNLDLKVYSDLTDITMDTPAEIELHRGILNVSAGSSFNATELPYG
jgi:hypothetical protein